ncbi:MAG: hypothetical protein C4293_13520 [Nitrospiraceae bacterium]
MGISISESTTVLHIPYGPFTNEGSPDTGFVDLKAHPEWISVMPPCLGWPETRDLLQAINAPSSPLMTLAADQAFTAPSQSEFKVALASFVTLCYADLPRNAKQPLADLAESLKARISDLLQAVSNELQQRLFLKIVLELQPTIFHHEDLEGWSLTVFMAAYGDDEGETRMTWHVGVRALQEAIIGDDAVR